MDSPKTSNDAQQQKKRNSNRRSRNNQTKNNGSAAQPLNQKSKPSADPKSKGHCSQQTTDKKNADGEKMNNNRHQSGRTSQKKNEEGDRRNFPDYYRPDVVQHALEKNVLFSGILRIHQKNYKEAYISMPNGGEDLVIQGVYNRNRALHGDRVVVDILPENDWKVLQEKFRDFVMLQQIEIKIDEENPIDPSSSIGLSTESIIHDDDAAEEDVENKPDLENINAVAVGQKILKCLDDGATNDTNTSDLAQGIEKININKEDAGNNAQKLPNGETEVIANCSTSPKKKTRRRSRGKGKSNKDVDVDKSVLQVDVNFTGKSNNGRLLRKHLSSTSDDPSLVSIHELKRIYPDSWENFVQKTGRVVAIKEEKHSRLTVGYLKIFQDKNPNFALFAPLDSKVPRMKIPRNQCPNDFWSRPQDFSEYLFIGKIVKWEQVPFAMGQLVESLGSDCDLEARTKGLLMENGVDFEEFDPKIESELPPLPFIIPPEEIAKRRDFRNQCVFTIDPLTARDLDDALSIESLENGKYKVGVHIADVSYFVRSNTLLDQEAEKRATSVYLVQKVVPMLPRTLCEHLCSLNPGEDRLTFSVEWIMNSSGEIQETWFGRSVICSAVKLAYEHAQDMLDNPVKDWAEDELPPINSPWNAKIISEKVNLLKKLAVFLRSKREENGALRLDQPKVCFSLDKESGMPQGYKLYEQRASNKLIEEFMLLANISVATKIENVFPNLALLRCHPDPKETLLEKSVDQLKKYGIDLDSTSSKSLANSLENYKPRAVNELEAIGKWQTMMSILSKAMVNAEYFCTGCQDDVEKYRHYALSVPLYTHFTSPIRRYPDVIVHRLLDAALQDKQLNYSNFWSPDTIQSVAGHCNDRKLAAKTISDKSAEMFMCLFIKQCGPITVNAVVATVMDYAVDCTLCDMGITKRVYVNKNEEIQSFEYTNYRGKLTLMIRWKGISQPQILQLFSSVQLSLETNGQNSLDFSARIIKS